MTIDNLKTLAIQSAAFINHIAPSTDWFEVGVERIDSLMEQAYANLRYAGISDDVVITAEDVVKALPYWEDELGSIKQALI